MAQLPSSQLVYKQTDVGTSSIMQPAPVIEENEDCLRLAEAAPVLSLFQAVMHGW